MKNPKIVPRPYQVECLDAISETVKSNTKRALVVMASGLGKTLTSAFAIERFFVGREFGRVLVLCHSETILSQSKDKYKNYFGEEYSYGMFTGHEKATRRTDFLFATFQTMKKYYKEFAKDLFNYIVVDEAHHSHACTYFPTIRYFDPEFLLGLTATPDRLDGQDIKEIYGAPVYELDFVAAMNRGLLAECDYQLVLDDMSQEKLDECLESGERLSIAQLNRTVFAPKRDEEIVRLIRQYSAEQQDPKTIIFCKTIEHARRVTKMMGEDVVLVHNGQSNLTNDMALEAFRHSKIRTIVSVQMLNEGIDVPDANVIVFLRNTVSEAIFYQQLGRGTRLSPGKAKVKVLDFVANCERVQAVLKLKQSFDGLESQQPVSDTESHGDSDTDSREKFTLNIATPEFKTKTIDIVSLLEKATNGREWTQEEVILVLQKRAKDLNKNSLMAKEIRDIDGMPSRQTIKKLFGSTRKAIQAAGLDVEIGFTNTDRGNFSSEEELFAAAREYAIVLGHPTYLTQKEINNNLLFPCWETLRKTYGNLGNFLRLAGMESRKERCSNIFNSKESVKEALEEKIASLSGKSPTKRQLERDKDMPRIYQILEFYDSYNDAIVDAGGKVNSTKKSQDEYPDTKMKEAALFMFAELGRAPSMEEWNDNPNTCSASILEKRHGSYNKAMLTYGITPNMKGAVINSHNKHSGIFINDTLSVEAQEKLQDIVRRKRRTLRTDDLCVANGLPTYSFFHSHHWDMTRINRCIDAERIVREVISSEVGLDPAVIKSLQEYVRKVGRPLKASDFNPKQEGMIGLAYLRNHNIASMEILNCIVGLDNILSKNNK